MAGWLFWICVVLVLYVYIGYPLLLGLLARLVRARPVPELEAYPPLTLLIAAYNEEAVITQKLENSLALNYPDDLQILVAADGSSDQTVSLAQQFADRGVEISYSPERGGKMAAINHAMEMVRGDIIVFSDANNLYDHDALLALVRPFADPSVGAATGAKRILESADGLSASEGLYWKYESWIKKQETRLGCCTAAAGEILAVRRQLFEAPPKNIINDDFYIAADLIRRNYRVVYVPSAQSFETVSGSAEDEMTRRSRIVAGRYQAILLAPKLLPLHRPIVVWQIVSHKFLRPLVPFMMLGALFATLAAIMLPDQSTAAGLAGLLHLSDPFGWIALALQMLFYGAAFIQDKAHSRISKLLYVPRYLVNSNLAALVGLWNYATGKQTHLWKRVQRAPISPSLPDT